MRNLVYFIMVLFMATTSSFAALSGNLTLQGVVPQLISVVVNAQSVASSLDLTTTQVDLNVASVQEKSNSKGLSKNK